MTNENVNIEPQVPINPLLKRAIIPGETFQLPSKGLMYNNGEIAEDVLNGELIVNPMITLDELILKTPDRLLNGTAIAEVFQRCVPQVLKPLNLFSKDLDYLLICLRKITYGDEFPYEYEHNCKDAESHSYMISLDQMISKTKTLSTNTIQQEYKVTLPNGQVVEIEPPRYKQVLEFFQVYNSDEANKLGTQDLANQIIKSTVNIIKHVDGITDKQHIFEWANTLPSGYIKQIGSVVENASEWGPDLDVEIVCKDCKTPVQIQMSLNPISFFS